MAWVSLTYLLEEKRDDTFAITLLQARSGIVHNTIPRGELIALSKGSQLHNEIINTIPIKISDDFILTDSKSSIYWAFRIINQETFVTKNVTRIKENININKILYCKSATNLADIGTKFARINRSIKMLNAEMVAPDSIYINGDTNLINFYQSLKNGIFVRGNQANILLSNMTEQDQDILEKDDKKKYTKLLREMKEL